MHKIQISLFVLFKRSPLVLKHHHPVPTMAETAGGRGSIMTVRSSSGLGNYSAVLHFTLFPSVLLPTVVESSEESQPISVAFRGPPALPAVGGG